MVSISGKEVENRQQMSRDYRSEGLKTELPGWLCLSWLEYCPLTDRLEVRFPVGAHA